ncbi:MAG TPA: hypothetical protein VGM93_13595 [Acidimicrobiales bacterium]
MTSDLDPIPPGPLVDRELNAALSALPVPDHRPGFWAELGHQLMAEQDAPAAPTLDPSARLAQHHGDLPSIAVPPLPTVEVLANQATKVRARPDRRRQGAIAAGVLAVAAVIAVAVAIGTNGSDRPLGTTADQVADRVAKAMAPYELLEAQVAVTGDTGTGRAEHYRLTRSADGSFRLRGRDVFTDVAYDARLGIAASAEERQADPGAAPAVEATNATGLAPGPPDQAGASTILGRDPVAAAFLDLRRAGTASVHLHTQHGRLVWIVDSSFAPADGSTTNRARVIVDHTSSLPLEVVEYHDTAVVQDARISGLHQVATVPADAFAAALPAGPTTSSDGGFQRITLDQAEALDATQVATPDWLPHGFVLDQVAVHGGTGAVGRSTAAGHNPADDSVVSLTYRSGAASVTITTRKDGGPGATWVDPFGTGRALPGTHQVRLDTGRFHGVTAHLVGAGGTAPTHLWGRGRGLVFTVSGDAAEATLTRIAGSLG